MEGADSQHLSDEPGEDGKLTDLTEQNEDSRSQGPDEQSEGGIQIRVETSEPHSSEEREDSTAPVSGSGRKSSAGWADNTTSYLTPELSTSSPLDFLSSDTLESTPDLSWEEDSQETSEYEQRPLSSWEKRATEWKFHRPGYPVLKQKPSFHRGCYSSAIEEMIKRSPQKLTKSSRIRGFKQERRAPHVKGNIISPYGGMPKPRIPLSIQKKKESKGFLKAQPHMTCLCEESCSHLGRKSKALYNLYTTFCDEKDADPAFLQGEEGTLGVSGLSRSCSIFSVLKKGTINVSNLLLTLHTMGILMAREDMHQALECVAVDERGNLNFLEFLNVISLTTTFSGTKALQKARQVFRNVKKDMVAVHDLEPTLDCLGVTLSPAIINQALGCIQITWDGKLNILDFLATVKELQCCCDKAGYLDEYPTLNGRYFGDGNAAGYSEMRWRRKCSSDREAFSHQFPMVTFCSAEEAVAYTELQRQKNKPQEPEGLKPPSIASPVCPTEENNKKEVSIKWPMARPAISYSSHDTLFPLEATLCSKKSEIASDQQEEPDETVDQSGEDSHSLLSRLKNIPKVNPPKKKKLSFSLDLPRRYSSEDGKDPSFTLLEPRGEGGAEDPPEQSSNPSSDAEGSA